MTLQIKNIDPETKKIFDQFKLDHNIQSTEAFHRIMQIIANVEG